MEIRLSDLKDKQVTTVSGERLGFISNVILDSTSGELKTLVISSEGEIPEGYQVDSDNMSINSHTYKSGQADDTPVEKCVFSLMNNEENDYEYS